MTAAVPRWVRACTVVAVIVVATVAAIVSYAHMRHLAELADEQWRADILPLSVDGLLVAASLVLLVRRKAGRRAGVLPWVGLSLGVGASLAANIAAAQATVLGRVVAGWPPVAFAVSFELLVAILRDGREATHRTGPPMEPADPMDQNDPMEDGGGLPEGLGRRRLAAELGVSEYAARRILAERNGAAS